MWHVLSIFACKTTRYRWYCIHFWLRLNLKTKKVPIATGEASWAISSQKSGGLFSFDDLENQIPKKSCHKNLGKAYSFLFFQGCQCIFCRWKPFAKGQKFHDTTMMVSVIGEKMIDKRINAIARILSVWHHDSWIKIRIMIEMTQWWQKNEDVSNMTKWNNLVPLMLMKAQLWTWWCSEHFLQNCPNFTYTNRLRAQKPSCRKKILQALTQSEGNKHEATWKTNGSDTLRSAKSCIQTSWISAVAIFQGCSISIPDVRLTQT